LHSLGQTGIAAFIAGSRIYVAGEASIHARIEALPWAGHAESRLALRKYKKTTLLADITIGNPSAVPQMSRYVNRLEMGRAMWEPVTQLLHVR